MYNEFWKTVSKFPILGGRLLKLVWKFVFKYDEEFPILGGRLLKLLFHCFKKIHSVSNPWREAIEETLKQEVLDYNYAVSNPWREAIEVDSFRR